MESIPNVPARIGAVRLKEIMFIALMPGISKWSQGYPNLTLQDLTLRKKNWAPIVPLNEMVQGTSDVDAIAEQFYVHKKPSKTLKYEGKQFKAGEITLFLAIDYTKHQAILMHIEEVSLSSSLKLTAFKFIPLNFSANSKVNRPVAPH